MSSNGSKEETARVYEEVLRFVEREGCVVFVARQAVRPPDLFVPCLPRDPWHLQLVLVDYPDILSGRPRREGSE